MGDVVRIVALGLVVSALLVFLRREQPAFGAQVAIVFVVIALAALLGPLRQVVLAFVELAREAEVRGVYLDLVLRAVAIAYIASLGAQLSRDAGEEAIGDVVELAGKVSILMLAVPVIAAILNALVGLLPG